MYWLTYSTLHNSFNEKEETDKYLIGIISWIDFNIEFNDNSIDQMNKKYPVH